ncbi:hypothetical protein DL93DRAFT_1328120 [Clavulina sp. PMI_390]|nr:hypothetical protein DL93DRAFT_1328120 [Clavulina sp. PMI_390]
MLQKGAACFSCRRRKEKCNGAKPICTRCQYFRRECVYASGITRLQTTAFLKLLERVQKMGNLREQLPLDTEPPSSRSNGEGRSKTSADVKRPHAPSPSDEAIPAILKQALNADSLTEFDDLPLPLSQHLISLFLPYRRHFFFFLDIPRFLECVSLPPSDPESIHPCLLNACYLGASMVGGKALTPLAPFFLKRTRYFLGQALMWADRVTHFLWASVILGCYFARLRRMEECFAM